MRATNALPIQHVSLAEEIPYRLLTLAVAQPRTAVSSHNHELDIVSKLRTMGPIYFPDITLYAVAHYGAAHLARYGQSQLPTLTCPPDRIAYEIGTDPLFAVFVDGYKLALLGQPLVSRKLLQARHKRLILPLYLLGRKALATLLPPAPDYFLTTCRRHALQETMVALSLNVGRLKCPFHVKTPRSVIAKAASINAQRLPIIRSFDPNTHNNSLRF